MKTMKTIFLLFIGALVMFWSCEEEALTYNFDAHVKKTVTANVKDDSLKSSLFSFEAIDTLDLKDNEEIEKNIEKIKELNVNSITCKLNGIPENEEITELNITILETGMTIKLTNITENNSELSLVVNNAIIDAIGEFLFTNQILVIKIDGKSTSAPIQLDVELDFNTSLKADLL